MTSSEVGNRLRGLDLLAAGQQLLLVVADGLDLGGGGALGVEAVGEPVEGELLGELNANDALAEAEDLSVVAEDGALDGEGVVGGHGANAGNLVGGDGNSEASAADEQAAVRLAFGDEFGALHGGVRVGSLVGGRVDADVGHGLDQRALLEHGLDGLLVVVTSIVTGHDNAEGLQVGGHGDGGGRKRRKRR